MKISSHSLDEIDGLLKTPCTDQDYLNGFFEWFLSSLEEGKIRCAMPTPDGHWAIDQRVKKGILLIFRDSQRIKISQGLFDFLDKKHVLPRHFALSELIRIVPGGTSVRRGTYLGSGVAIMPPSYINIGAFVDEGTMVDSHVLVGSCAQIGKRVHLSTGVQIGGVLEPIGSLPVIIEDDVMLGGQVGVFEGTMVRKRAVLGAGVILTQSSQVYDIVLERVIQGSSSHPLEIPENAVVVPGARPVDKPFAKKHGLSISTPIIVKYRDARTDDKVKLESLLRDG